MFSIKASETLGTAAFDMATSTAAGALNDGHAAHNTSHRHVPGVSKRLQRQFTLPRQFTKAFNPEVTGHGADFGDLDPSKEQVVLRIEIAESVEVKFMGLVSLVLATLSLGITIVLTILKFTLAVGLIETSHL